jgi:hypothetical protein
MQIARHLATLGMLAMLGSGVACADDQKKQASPPSASPSPSQIPPTIPDPGVSGSSQESLSDKLSRSGGVIKPPADVDPAMKQTPPPTGPQSMPIIPPPGSPGGSQPVQPK